MMYFTYLSIKIHAAMAAIRIASTAMAAIATASRLQLQFKTMIYIFMFCN